MNTLQSVQSSEGLQAIAALSVTKRPKATPLACCGALQVQPHPALCSWAQEERRALQTRLRSAVLGARAQSEAPPRDAGTQTDPPPPLAADSAPLARPAVTVPAGVEEKEDQNMRVEQADVPPAPLVPEVRTSRLTLHSPSIRCRQSRPSCEVQDGAPLVPRSASSSLLYVCH